MIYAGIPARGVLEKIGGERFPASLIRYLFCSPKLDFSFRCLPSAGGLYDQLFRDFAEFNIIESKLRFIHGRNRN